MNLKDLIKKDLKLTQKKFAEELGVHENTVNNWCKGNSIKQINVDKIINYYKNRNLPTQNLAIFLLERYGLTIPFEESTIYKKEIDELKKKNEKLLEINKKQAKINKNLEQLNELYGKEIKFSELKQWSPSGTARQILDSKDFEPIVAKLLKTYSLYGVNKLKSELCNIIKQEVTDMIKRLHNQTVEKEKKRLMEKIKRYKE